MELQFDRSINILICEKNSVYIVHSCCTFRLAILWLKDRSLDYFAHKFGLGLSTQRFTSLGTALTDMISSVYKFLVLNFCTQSFLWGGASLIENWILEGDEQGNIPENAFVFLSIVFGLIVFGAKLWVNDRVIPRKKKNPHKLNL